MADVPIICTLDADALKARKAGLLSGVAQLSMQTLKLADGYRFEFALEAGTLHLVADMIDAERHCCRFLRFVLTVEPAAGLIRLDVTGPEGAQEFLAALLTSA